MPKIPLLDFIKNRGVHAGLGQTNNSIKMAGLILLPLIVPWLLVQMFVSKEQSAIYTPIVFAGWLAVIIIYYFAKKATASEYTAFPQAGWQFPDGQQIRYDVLILPNRGEGQNGWEPVVIGETPIVYGDGSTLYKVTFKDKLAYQDPKRDVQDVFEEALWKLPASWTESFDFNGFGEFFYEGLFITHAKCENIEIAVVDWDERGGSRIPVCIVTACSWYQKLCRKNEGKVLPKALMNKMEAKQAVIADLKKRNSRLLTRNEYLEQEAERHDKEEPAIIKERLDREKDKMLEEYSDITDIKPPLSKRLWRNAKYFVYLGIAALIILGIMYLLGAI
jgi:hypothetical protein